MVRMCVLLALLPACKPTWVVVEQAAPSPLTASAGYAVDPITFEHLKVDTLSEEDYLDNRDDITARDWREAKDVLSEEMVEQARRSSGQLDVFAGPSSDAEFSVACDLESLAFGVTGAITVGARAWVSTADGGLVDEITISTRASTSPMGPLSERMAEAGRALGEVVAKYLDSRVSDRIRGRHGSAPVGGQPGGEPSQDTTATEDL